LTHIYTRAAVHNDWPADRSSLVTSRALQPAFPRSIVILFSCWLAASGEGRG